MTARLRRTLAVAAGCALVPALAAQALSAPAPAEPAARPDDGAVARSLAGAASAKPPVRLPRRPAGLPAPRALPAEVDAPAGYQPQTSCAARALPGVVRLRALALATYGRGGQSPARPRTCTSGSASEHKDGRAWDWMLDVGNRADRTAAADFLGWLTEKGPSGTEGEMAARLGVMYVIYNHKIWSSYAPGWRDYSGYDPHTSHIHVSLSWNGARAHTSFWTGRTWATDYGVCQVFAGQPGTMARQRPRTTPCPAPADPPRASTDTLAWLGSSGSRVGAAQQALGVDRTDRFDRPTRRAVARYQRGHDLPRTGALDEPTWASLMPATRQLRAPAWKPRRAVTWATHHGVDAIRPGDAGRAVYALQIALRLADADRNGYYGPVTRATVGAVRAAGGLPPSGLVNADVWALLPLPPPTRR